MESDHVEVFENGGKMKILLTYYFVILFNNIISSVSSYKLCSASIRFDQNTNHTSHLPQ